MKKKACPTCSNCVHVFEDCTQEPNMCKYCNEYDICLDCSYYCVEFEPAFLAISESEDVLF